MKVYCEHGAMRRDLVRLQAERRIEIATFPYEEFSRRVKLRAIPSDASWDELNLTWDQLRESWDDF